MKRVNFRPHGAKIIVLAALALLCCVFACFAALHGNVAAAESGHGGDYRFEIGNYNVTYDVNNDCSVEVTEILTVNYLGTDSTGFLRDIPVNGGVQVKNIAVEGVDLLDGGSHVPYEVRIEDQAFITVDIGSRLNKYNRSETYKLTYLYCIENSVVKKGNLSLNPIGTGWECVIRSAEVTVKLPAGYISGSAERFMGTKGSSSSDKNFLEYAENGKTVITTAAVNLPAYTGITFDFKFEEGALSPYFDFTPYWFVIAAGVLILITILVNVLFFNKHKIIPVVNFEAPDGMDPLIMGKLIDNKVNAEDVTALIYYWADKGYIVINLDDKDNPTMIKIKNLPPTAADYERIVFDGLFRGGDSVRTSDLKNVFYRTFQRATAMVNSKANGLFESSSIGVSVIFALLGGLIIGLAPVILAFTSLGYNIMYMYGFIAILPALVIYGLTESVMYNRLKNTGGKNALYLALVGLGILVCTGVFVLIIPSSLIPIIPKALLLLAGFTEAALSVMVISRTEEYSKKLNGIVGFRNFIVTAEKDRLEKLIDGDPQYYYHILPYAQVLNVSDVWEEKFKDITVAPPAWATASAYDNLLDFVIINSLIRRSMASITAGMISTPSSSGSNGNGGFGGGFGGHAGGGFGGGGGRGR